MTNEVDTSIETVNMEFDAAEQEIGSEETEQAQANAEQAAQEQAELALLEAQKEAEIKMATGMIASSLKLTIGGMAKVMVDDRYYNEAAKAYAILIIKYFPGGMFALLDRYKEEIGAATATFMLVRIVTEAMDKKEEEENKQKEEKEGDMPKPKEEPGYTSIDFEKEPSTNG